MRNQRRARGFVYIIGLLDYGLKKPGSEYTSPGLTSLSSPSEYSGDCAAPQLRFDARTKRIGPGACWRPVKERQRATG